MKQDQIPTFLADNQYVNSTGQRALYNPSPQTVYAIWIGTNDLGNGVFLTESQPKGLPITNYTDCVFEQLDRLYAIGARRFVIMNIAPLDLSPQYALPENGGVTAPRYWKDKIQYNSNLTQISEKMRQYCTLVNAIYEYQIPYELKVMNRFAKSQFALFDVHSLVRVRIPEKVYLVSQYCFIDVRYLAQPIQLSQWNSSTECYWLCG